MAEEQKDPNHIPVEERTKTCLFVEADSLTLDMEGLSEQIKKAHAELEDKRGELQILEARDQQLHGKYAELNAIFWHKARKEIGEWMQEIQGKGYAVKCERVKQENGPTEIRAVAYNPAEEQMLRIHRMIQRRDNPNQQ